MKKQEPEKTKRSRYFYAYLEGWISIAVNLILFGMKYWVGFMTGSIAIIADAWHTLSDSFTSIVILVGTRASRKPSDKEHPFGHGRIELIASVIIGVLLVVVGFNFIVESVQKLRLHAQSTFSNAAVWVFAASLLSKEGLAQFSIWGGKKSGIAALRADGWHHRSDAIASAAILAGIFIGRYAWWVDGVLGIVVSLFIIYAAVQILREGISPLLGEAPGEKLEREIIKIANEVTGRDIQVHHLHIHRYGNHTEMTFHIYLPGVTQLRDAHALASCLEESIRHRLHIESTIHIEPE